MAFNQSDDFYPLWHLGTLQHNGLTLLINLTNQKIIGRQSLVPVYIDATEPTCKLTIQ
jgi:hypothetical protein